MVAHALGEDRAGFVVDDSSGVHVITSLQIPRQELVSRIIADMTGAIGAATVAAPNPEDNIGAIQELRFSQSELDHIYRNLGPVDNSRTIEGVDAKYWIPA